MDVEVEGKRGRGRPLKRWGDVVQTDMKRKGTVAEDAQNRPKWRSVVRAT